MSDILFYNWGLLYYQNQTAKKLIKRSSAYDAIIQQLFVHWK